MKGRYALNLVPQTWSLVDRLKAMAYRWTPSVAPAVRVDELMSLRHNAILVCAICALKYRDGLRRYAYARHPDMKTKGNPCDFCRQIHTHPIPIYFKEEAIGRYPTLNQSEQMRRLARSPFPENFRGDVRPHRHRARPAQRGSWVPNTPEARERVICVP